MRAVILVILVGALFAADAPASADEAGLLRAFRQPPREYSPVPIWWWSGGRIEKDRLEWQLERMVEGHVYNAIVLNLDPSSDCPNYFSSEWWKLMDFTLERAKKLGVGIWFYDHLGFARSDIHEELTLADPAFRAEKLDRAEKDVSAGEEAVLRVPGGARFVAATASAIRQGSILCDTQDLSPLVSDGLLKWTPSDGRWRVMLFFARRADFDFSNPEAAAKLIDSVHGEYERRYAGYLGSVIPGSFQDEFPRLPNWSRRFLDQFRKCKGYDLASCLPALYHNHGPKTWKYRFDYRDVMARISEEAFFKPCFDWHERHGMICGMDQRVRDADPVDAQRFYADYFRTMRWYGAPGQDQNGDARPRSSIAHLYGRPRVWQEGFHSTGWGQTLEELADLVNGFYLRGANLYNPHAWYYNTAGSWWEFAPPCTSFRQPYWRHYSHFADYVARMSYILSRGSHVCDIAVLYPSTTIQADMTIDGRVSAVGRATRDIFWSTLTALDEDNRDFDWMDEASLRTASCKNGQLHAGSESYRVLILPGLAAIQCASADVVRGFAESGGTVLVVGGAPTGSAEKGADDSDMSDLFRMLAKESRCYSIPNAGDLPEILASVLRRDHSPDVRCLHRVIDGLHFYFVVVGDSSAGEAVFGVPGRPEVWDPYTGKTHSVPRYEISGAATEVALDFDLSPAYFVVIDPSDTRPAPSSARVKSSPTVMSLDGEWDFRLEPTMDNRWGDFGLPQTGGFMPVETREFRYAEDPKDEGLSAGWHLADFDDSKWGRTVYTHAPYWYASDWIKASGPDEFGKPLAPESWEPDASGWRPVVFSRRLGIEKDPLFAGVRFRPESEHIYFSGRTVGLIKERPRGGSQYGPKSRVSEEFADLGSGSPWSVRYLGTYVLSPEPCRVEIEMGCRFAKRVWLNGELVLDQPREAEPMSRVPVALRQGWNRILIKVAQSSAGNVRISFALRGEGSSPGAARWIWARPTNSGTAFCRKVVDLPGEPKDAHVNIACDNAYELYVNGKLVASRVRYRADYWRSGNSHHLPLHKGRNIIAVKATNLGGPAGLLIWGSVSLPSGKRVPIVTDETWLVSSEQHPGWLEGEPSGPWRAPVVLGTIFQSRWGNMRWGVDPADQVIGPRMPCVDMPGLVYDPNPEAVSVAWYRFDLPPGTRSFRIKAALPCDVYVNGERQTIDDGGLVRLTSPAIRGGVCAVRVLQKPGIRAGAVFLEPVQFDCREGKITLGSWHEKGLPTYSGIGIYSRELELSRQWTANPLFLDLGEVRGTAELSVNGKPAGVRIWRPYRFDISGLVHEGGNKLEVLVTNTLGPHYSVGMPTPYVFPGQEISGVMGPVTVQAGGG